MRISDWSSDVCSSDLGPGRANDYAAGRRSLPAETVNYVAQIAPGLGMASIASPAAMPTANAHPWRQATLFTPRGDGEASSTDGAADVQPQRTQLASPSASLPLSSPAPHPLFVSLSPRNP